MCEERFLWEKSLYLVHLLQKKFKDCNVYLRVYIHAHVYLTYIADNWSKILWKRMTMIANDFHRSMEVCIATLHAASSCLFGDPLCHSPLHPPQGSALPLLPRQRSPPHTFFLRQIGNPLLKTQQTKTNPHIHLKKIHNEKVSFIVLHY